MEEVASSLNGRRWSGGDGGECPVILPPHHQPLGSLFLSVDDLPTEKNRRFPLFFFGKIYKL